MNADTLLENFEILAEAPGGIDRLRELILKMAVSGKLVEQSQDDGDASELIPKYVANQKLMTDDGVIGTQRFQRGGNSPQLPYHIPKNWRWHYLGDVGAIIGGGTPSSSVSSYWSGHDAVPWLTPADMRKLSSRYAIRGRRDITPKGLTESSAQLLPRGAVLFSSRAPIGHVAIAAQPLATNQGFKSCVPYIAEMNEYIYFFLLQIGPQVDANATGTTFKEVSGKQVAQILIPVPPLAEQRRIVAKADELMALCDQLEQQQKQRDNLRTATRKSAIDAISTATTPEELEAAWKRINNNWEVIADTQESLESLRELILDLAVRGDLGITDISAVKALILWDVEEQKLDVDKLWKLDTMHLNPANGWSRLPLARLGSWGSGGTPTASRKEFYNNGSIPWAVIGDLNNGIMTETSSKITQKALASSSAKLIPKNAVLIAMYGASIGKTAVTGIDCTTNQAIAHCIVDESVVSTEYFFLVAKSLKKHLVKVGKGAAQPNISQTVLKHLLIDVPQLNAQQIVVSKVNEFMALCDQLEAELKFRSEVAEKFARSVVNAA